MSLARMVSATAYFLCPFIGKDMASFGSPYTPELFLFLDGFIPDGNSAAPAVVMMTSRHSPPQSPVSFWPSLDVVSTIRLGNMDARHLEDWSSLVIDW